LHVTTLDSATEMVALVDAEVYVLQSLRGG
jgi:hypothetical protein